MGSDWFKPPADTDTGAAGRIENAACRKALTLAGIAPAGVAADAGLGAPHTARFTFAALREFCDFPADARVTAEPPDEVGKILTKFRKTRLFVAWLDYEADDPAAKRGSRAMLFKGLTWGVSVLYEKDPATPDPDDRPFIACGRPERDLRIEPYVGWLRHVGWSSADAAEVRDDDF